MANRGPAAAALVLGTLAAGVGLLGVLPAAAADVHAPSAQQAPGPSSGASSP